MSLTLPLLAPAAWALGVIAWRWLHQTHLERCESVTHRILVGGSRGKSTQVRLIVAALRAAPMRAAGRITGVVPHETQPSRDWRPEVTWRPLPRPNPPDIDEIRRWLAVVIPRTLPEAIVLENMAVTPELMRALGQHLFPPTLAVVTDAAPDHRDLWPRDPMGLARMHVEAIPPGLPIATADPRIAHAAREHGAEIIEPVKRESDSTLPEWMNTHVALALAVAKRVSGDMTESMTGAALREATTLTPHAVTLKSGARFLDLFGCNDPVTSASALLSFAEASECDRRVAIFADRADRSWRRALFAPWLRQAFDETFILAPRACRGLRDFSLLGEPASLFAGGGAETLFVGVGNSKGLAEDLLADLPRSEADHAVV